MNSVQITEQKNTVSVNETTNTVTVTEGSSTVVTVSTEGPQGATGPAGTGIDTSNAVDDSLLYFDASSGTLKLDNTTTKLSLVFGGSF
tara:strand:+ start:194 stop:457 length:264 start_codon:yes stop_codon:yes gene_type:complete